jgi:hypothetical protein
VEIIGEALRFRCFSAEAAACIANLQISSTIAIYESKWRKFAVWCSEQKIDPLHPTVPQVASFLLDLHAEGLKLSTIDGYHSAIATTIRATGGPDFGHDPQLTSLIKSLYIKILLPDLNLLPGTCHSCYELCCLHLLNHWTLFH